METTNDTWNQAIRQFSEIRPMLGTHLHILIAALFVIYTGAHASLTRPTSAAKPAKREKGKGNDGEDEPSESLQKMEGLSAIDALMFPILAGSTLAGLYFIIKWLEDPAILNKLLNWYFTAFGLFGTAKLLTDGLGVLTSFAFPSKYSSDGQVWVVKPTERIVVAVKKPSARRSSPLPGILSKAKFPQQLASALWTLRELPSQRIHIRAYVHKLLAASVHIGPQGILSFLIALAVTSYFNLVAKPWWLTNLLGYSFAYSFLQLMSPSTFSTGSLILAALFVYDIYFVFFTPMMVTVATQLDIPAKMLFPRPVGPKDDPAKEAMSMLGLGDIVLPGLVMGFALRFDLYLFYLRKQKRRSSDETEVEEDGAADRMNSSDSTSKQTSEIVKAEYKTATGGWGERFWTGKCDDLREPTHGGIFRKTYFYASIRGYIAGMVTTLCVMTIYGHAQPALLYLVPGVLGSLWITAFFKGDLKTMWDYDEMEAEDTTKKPDEPKKSLKSIFSWSRQEEIEKRLEGVLKGNDEKKSTSNGENQVSTEKSKQGKFFRDRDTEIVFFSINLPTKLSDERKELSQDETTGKEPKLKPSVEDELRMAFEGEMADTPPSTRTRSMRKSMLNGEVEPPVKRIKRL